jgi:alkylhydroperoxidase/carboxymuconolactone decarboxylase family protein YurZ
MLGNDRRGLFAFAVASALVVGVVAYVRTRRSQTPADSNTLLTKGPVRMTDEKDTPVLDLLAAMTADSLEASTLDAKTFMIARLAAMVAVGAPPASYLLNLGAAADVGIDAETVRGVLTAVAPIVGTPRVVAASGNIVRALGVALDVAEEVAELEAGGG